LKQQGRITSPRRGFYVVVPPEYRAAGSPPASWFIDDLMRYLGQPYYVGLLSAAAIHGAAHQQPIVFQVVTSRPTREMRAGKVAIQFSMSALVERLPVIERQTETGTMRVAAPETCAFDLVRYPEAAGHLSNAATVLAELAERLDARRLVDVARIVRLPDAQRLGYLLNAVGHGEVAVGLAEWLASKQPRAVPLQPGEGARAEVDPHWHVVPNVELDVEV
ncbi:MAG: hypothetical protein KJ042_12815, partial [Deltaproteobacteria bacterium]|nr:hypothetical protein [Deltaproteobacteria bacterium]